ncbi:ABC transporter ATP-binding protein [Gracilibacillus caseinilyticus]|uniref:ABC transporter ATP-binding protein n=1 Tax=Gracilibacillus caseinilyticus TaxID=2932256 RepID=A0ABY4F225_9BACI|nr:ABC transporter ATP-binding protein [Gracilibacillus caseinilyticus]UOQ48476.1 ABC transporter ATP-binding protein [Gracilibacillus caseinilyticus]
MIIKATNLAKYYRSERALGQLNLTIDGPKIIGLLGNNGAGKTTLLRLLAGHFQQTSGELTINDITPFNHHTLTKEICLIMENDNFHGRFKVQDILKISSMFYPNWNHEYAERLRHLFRLKPKQKVKTLSKGMYSALGIIVGLASHAPITIFDEPYIGLDASSRSAFYDLLLESYQENPRLIILSTHLIDEVSRLFEEAVILKEGELLLHETVESLEKNHTLVSGPSETVDQITKGRNIIHSTTLLGKKSVVLYQDHVEASTEVSFQKVSLQELFVYLTNEGVTIDA